MKLIKARKETPTKPVVGDIVKLSFVYFDGRTTEHSVEEAKVVKVNRVTFDAITSNGDTYRVGFNDPDFIGISKKA